MIESDFAGRARETMADWFRKYQDNFGRRQLDRVALPGWFKAVHVAIFLGSLLLSFLALLRIETTLYAHLHPGLGFADASRTAQKVMVFSILPGTLGPTFALANFLEWAIKPMRDVWDRRFEGVQGARLSDAMRVTAWLLGLTLVSLCVAWFGALDPWRGH